MDITTVVVSILGSSLVTSLFSHWSTAKEKVRELKREKLEKLFLAGVNHCNFLLISITMTAAYHNGKITKATIFDWLKENNEKNKAAAEGVTMYCKIYFPEITPSLERIEELREKIGEGGFRSAAHGDAPNRELGSAILHYLEPLQDAQRVFNRKIYEVGQKINK